MLLAIDIGNTHLVLGVFEHENRKGSWRLRTEQESTVDELALQVLTLLRQDGYEPRDISQIIISCVVPPLLRVTTKLAEKYFSISPIVIGPGIKTGMEIAVDDPRSVGADRIVNAVAAKQLYGAPAIVVDFGTATTFDVVDERGAYAGGVIAPGLMISANALFERASQLPRIEIREPAHVIGKNTLDAMRSGLYFGYASLVDGLIERIQNDMGLEPNVIATGGLSRVIAAECSHIDEVVPDLTLQGLQIIAKMNSV